jgi:PAS domain S-box-containing protein
MVAITSKSGEQKAAEAAVESFRHDLGPFVVAAQKTRMPMIFTDAGEPAHPIIFANNAFLSLTGYEREEVLAKGFKSLMAVGIDEEAMARVDAAFEGNGGSDPEIHYRRKDGSEFWASLFVSPVCDENGKVLQQFVSFVDLTKHRQDATRCKMLIDELNHRVKNTLATVQSIVAQALRGPAEPAAVRQAIESRILALSRSHDLLTSAKWEGAGLRDLVKSALQPFEANAAFARRFTVEGDNLRLPPKTTLSLAIALHELATNAVKHGAFSNGEGTVAIGWAKTPGVTGDRLVLRWREQGGPPVAVPTKRGFGSWVIERGLAHELEGKVALDYLPGGVACTIDIPAPAGAGQ